MQEQPFYLRRVDWLVSPPALGFLFPAFDERSTNLYGALYYSKSTTEAYEAFVDAVFHTQPPMPADAQRETFQNLLAQSLDDECRYGVVQAVNDELCTLIEDHRASRDPEPLAVSKETVRHVLENCGVSEQHVATFSVQFDEQFGAEAQLRPDNLVDSRQFRVRSGEGRGHPGESPAQRPGGDPHYRRAQVHPRPGGGRRECQRRGRGHLLTLRRTPPKNDKTRFPRGPRWSFQGSAF